MSLSALALLLLGSFSSAQNVVHELQIIAPSAFPSEYDFGASLALDGATLVVGAPGLVWRNVVVHEWSGNFFNETTRLDPVVGPGASPEVGRAVAIDGDTLAAGAPGDDQFALNDGSVHVYLRTTSGWRLQQVLREPPIGFQSQNLGRSLSLSGDELVVGAPMINDVGAGTGAGRVYVYARSAGVWSRTATLTANDPTNLAGFGFSVAFDRDRIAVGAPGSGGGAVYVFERSGGAWAQVAKQSGTGKLGTEVRLAGDTVATRSSTGAVTVWRGGGAVWTEELLSPAIGSLAGSIDLEADSLVAGILGATPYARHFSRAGATWTADVDFVPSQPVAPFHWFGQSVTMKGADVAVGAPKGSFSSASDAGYVYFFRSNLSGPVGTPYCTANDIVCPCSNDPAPNAIEGCVNSSGRGAHLEGQGSSSIARNDFTLVADGLALSKPSLAIVSPSSSAPLPFYAGRLCLGGMVQRIGSSAGNPAGTAVFGPSFPVTPWTAGDTRFFQVIYRDAPHGACTARANVSNALTVQFVP